MLPFTVPSRVRPCESKRGSLRVSTPSTPASGTQYRGRVWPLYCRQRMGVLRVLRVVGDLMQVLTYVRVLRVPNVRTTHRDVSGQLYCPIVNEHSQSACALRVSRGSPVSTHGTPPRVQPSPLARMRVRAFACAHPRVSASTTKIAGAPSPPPPTVEAVDDTGTPLYTAGVSTHNTPGQYEYPTVSTEKYPM